MRGEEVFEKLKRTDSFDTSIATESQKRRIFLDVWEKCAASLRREYNRSGLSRTSDGVGFGYLVEEFARQSSRVPRNTQRGAHIADLLLGFLRSGDEFGMTGLRKRLYNPDFLQVEITGRRIVITGLTEVKASAEALRMKLDSQIANQEGNLRVLVAAIENKKQTGSAHQFFKKRKILVAENMNKVVVVPLGEGNKVRAFLPQDWGCVELEFSYRELVFIAKSIWPDFKAGSSQQTATSDGYIAVFERDFLAPLTDLIGGRLQGILSESKVKKIPAREILLAVSCLGKIPLLDNDINWMASYLQRSEFFGLFPGYVTPTEELTRPEKTLLDKLVEWHLRQRLGLNRDTVREHALFFLFNLNSFKKVLYTALRNDEESSARVSRMDDYNLSAFLQ